MPSEALRDFWNSDELSLQALAFLPPLDLRSCSQVSRSFNRIAVLTILDQHKILDVRETVYLELAGNPYDFDVLSALLFSVHLSKTLGLVKFNLARVTSLRSAVKSFSKMQRLVERIDSLKTAYVHWPGDAYRAEPIGYRMLASACKRVEGFLDAIIAKGCTSIRLTGFNALVSEYKLKKNPAISNQSSRSTVALKPSFWGHARGYISSLQSPGKTLKMSALSDQANYCRKRSLPAFGISAPWISLHPSPMLGQVTKLTSFCAHSTHIFRPPFSQWTFALLQQSPIAELTVSFKDLPEDEAESRLILERLAEAVPDPTTIYIRNIKRGNAYSKEVLAWLARFKNLKVLRLKNKCFAEGTDLAADDLVCLPRLNTLESSPPFRLLYLGSRRGVDEAEFQRLLGTLILRLEWRKSSQSAVSAVIQSVALFHQQVVETLTLSEMTRCTISVQLLFDDFSLRAKELKSVWAKDDFAFRQLPGEAAKKRNASKDQRCFRPSGPRPCLCLQLHLPATADEIQEGVIDEEIMEFCRLFPTLRKIRLCPPQAVPRDGRVSLKRERLERIRSICPNIHRGWVYTRMGV